MIAVDAMGGDNAPGAVVVGAVAAARSGIPILLCGQQEAILAHMPSDWQTLPIEIEDCPDLIDMGEDPSRAIRTKPNSSLVRAMRAVSQGRCSAFFSAGNSGAVMVGSVLIVGRVRGVHRPAVGAFLPSKNGSFFCLDVGANVDCKAQYLYQFALMGHAYLEITQGNSNPRIGLLSNGHEPYKGPQEIKKTYERLSKSSLNFVGNVESRELSEGIVDVVVCDGFVGNVMLKTMQGTARAIFSWVKQEANSSLLRKFLTWLNSGLFAGIKQRVDYQTVGGALMLGVNRPVVLAHGRSSEHAVANGIRFASQIVQSKQVERFNAALKNLIHDKPSFTGAVTQKVRSLFHWGQS